MNSKAAPKTPRQHALEGLQNGLGEEIRVARVRRALAGFLHHARRQAARPIRRDLAAARLREAREELEQLELRYGVNK